MFPHAPPHATPHSTPHPFHAPTVHPSEGHPFHAPTVHPEAPTPRRGLPFWIWGRPHVTTPPTTAVASQGSGAVEGGPQRPDLMLALGLVVGVLVLVLLVSSFTARKG